MLRRNQNGAVWVEFLVAASTVLLSMFFLIPMLGKYMDIRHSTESAARYSAWERTVWHGSVGEYDSSNTQQKLSSHIENESNHRVLGSGNTLIYGEQKNDSDQQNMNVDSMHYFNNHNTEQYEELLKTKSNTADTSKQYFSLIENQTEAPGFSAIDTIFGLYGWMMDGGFSSLEDKGYYTETVSTSAKTPTWMGESQYIENSTPFVNDVMSFTASNSILVDGWGAGGSDDNIERVRDMKAKFQEDSLDFDVEAMKFPYIFFRPFVEELWDIDVDKIDDELLLDETHLGQY
jgi:hypothetical protein